MAGHVVRHVVIRGRVQGVGFRPFVEHEARHRHLDGWVRNRRDGSVEAVFAGPAEIVAQTLAACHRGPYLSRVDSVDAKEDGDDDAPVAEGDSVRGFRVLPTL